MPDNVDQWFEVFYPGTLASPQTVKYFIKVCSYKEDMLNEINSRDPRGIIVDSAFWEKRLLSGVKNADGTMLTSIELEKMSRSLRNGLEALWGYINNVDDVRFLELMKEAKAIQSQT